MTRNSTDRLQEFRGARDARRPGRRSRLRDAGREPLKPERPSENGVWVEGSGPRLRVPRPRIASAIVAAFASEPRRCTIGQWSDGMTSLPQILSMTSRLTNLLPTTSRSRRPSSASSPTFRFVGTSDSRIAFNSSGRLLAGAGSRSSFSSSRMTSCG